ncbi:DUF7264 domain-containing protein [Prescottella agglutinans]|uniref:LtfC/p132/Gp6 beta-sandwich domain-containing protein n=1 Tax=Prescottella agglutinans TaxID=1644129 RepID=A0ABT6M623_9NOCA|nr:hypothetical protein [Prescottella agglutinans]MDH6279329.1 hypothetical protein [Prescottella agglutinans]
MSAPLGHVPEKRPLILSKGADFIQQIEPKEADSTFPEGSTARIVIVDSDEVQLASWPAEVQPSQLFWRVESEQADTIPDRSAYRLYLSFPTVPFIDVLWFYGTVQRKQ